MEQDKFYITKQKLQEIKDEYKELLDFERKKTKGETPKIFESEDLNPEYVSYQEDLSFLRARIQGLENIFKNYELIKIPPKGKQNIVGLGAKVIVAVEGEKDEFIITGTLEANPSLGRISNESPVGRALVGHKVGDEIMISSPIKVVYKILKINYSSS